MNADSILNRQFKNHSIHRERSQAIEYCGKMAFLCSWRICEEIRCVSDMTDNTNYGMLQGTVKAMFSPVMDIIRPSKKENFKNLP